MAKKPLIIALFLTLLLVVVASAKSYSFRLVSPATAGTAELKAGDYELKLDQTTATLKRSSGKAISLPVKVEVGDEKFDETGLEISTKDGKSMITAIKLGGSKTRLVFGQ